MRLSHYDRLVITASAGCLFTAAAHAQRAAEFINSRAAEAGAPASRARRAPTAPCIVPRANSVM
jgi:hypothetical protein